MLKLSKHLPLGMAFAAAMLHAEMRKAAGGEVNAPKMPGKTYQPNGAKECARRVRQIEARILTESSQGVIPHYNASRRKFKRMTLARSVEAKRVA